MFRNTPKETTRGLCSTCAEETTEKNFTFHGCGFNFNLSAGRCAARPQEGSRHTNEGRAVNTRNDFPDVLISLKFSFLFFFNFEFYPVEGADEVVWIL